MRLHILLAVMAGITLAPPLSPGGARAQAGSKQDSVMTVPSDTRVSKSPGRAATLSFLGTAAPIGLGFLLGAADNEAALPLGLIGVAVGPSLGHFYSENSTRGIVGVALRSGSLAGIVLGVELAGDGDRVEAGALIVGASLGVGLFSMLADMLTADDSARDYNAKQRADHGPVPIVAPGPLGELRVGIATTF